MSRPLLEVTKQARRYCLKDGCPMTVAQRGFCATHERLALVLCQATVVRDDDGDGDVECWWCHQRAPIRGNRVLRHHDGPNLCNGSNRSMGVQ